MSSEAEARIAIDDAIARYGHTRQAYGQYWKPYGKGGELLQQFADQLQPNRDALNTALDAYRTQIERRVLAQQPCYRLGWPSDEGGVNCVELRLMCAEHTHQPPTLCPTCIARAAQTQETSG